MEIESKASSSSTTGALILLDIPHKIQLGIDNISVRLGSKFKGVRNIPQGTHFVHYTLDDENHMFKISFFFYVKPGTVHVRKWNNEIQDFLDIDSTEEGERYISGTRNMEFDAYLAPYPMDRYELWKQLSYYITPKILEKVEPVGKKLYSESNEYDTKEGENTKEDFKVINGTIYFTEIPKKFLHFNSTPDYITKNNFDKTLLLKKLIEKEYNNDFRLFFGEMQYAFIGFILAENLDSFDQWKKMFILASSCEDYLKENSAFYYEFIPIIYAQLQQFPKDFFIDSITSNNFMSNCLKYLLELADDPTLDHKLLARFKKLKEMLNQKFEFIVSKEGEQFDIGEDAPTVVNDFEFIKL